ncbi:hypothetical protein [Maridesulfovibrio sp.]|uniref:hypothetical protein n=1 Tax=Maridesulfovibrio sp. TaxID=2795000 RepID=UPI0039EEFB35
MKYNVIHLINDQPAKNGDVYDLSELLNLLNQGWKDGTLSCLSHDMLRPQAWIDTLGIVLDSKSASLYGLRKMPQNTEEIRWLKAKAKKFVYENFYSPPECDVDELQSGLRECLSGNENYLYLGCSCVCDEDIVSKKFPDIAKNCDKSGLIPLNRLSPIGIGVFEFGEYVIFAHEYFRRHLHRLNNINKELLDKLTCLSKNGANIKIALDFSLIGLKKTFFECFEYEHWWGPKFSNDVSNLKEGVCCHSASDEIKKFHKIHKQDFFWYKNNNEYTFETEEISLYKLHHTNFEYGCRYIHSIIDINKNMPIHLDGAIRGYSIDEMLERENTDITHQRRGLIYKKLWRVDGDINLSDWKELICHHYKDNPLAGEYLGPISVSAVNDKIENEDFKDFENAGPNCMISLLTKKKFNNYTDDFNVLVTKNIHIDGEPFSYVEDSFYELNKFFLQHNKKLSFHSDHIVVAFEDNFYDLPLIYHAGSKAIDNANFSLDVLSEFFKSSIGRDEFFSFSLAIEYEEYVLVFSLVGEIKDLYFLLNSNKIKFPNNKNKIDTFIKETYKHISEIKNSILPKIEINILGYISFKRIVLYENIDYFIERINDQDMFIYADPRLGELLGTKINIATEIIKTSCTSCKADYLTCPCLRSTNSSYTITDYNLLGFCAVL